MKNKLKDKNNSIGEKMKLISWNVNGLRAAVNKGFKEFKKLIIISFLL